MTTVLAVLKHGEQNRYTLPLGLSGVLLDILGFDQGVVLGVQVATADVLGVPQPLILEAPSYPGHEIFVGAVDGVEAPEEGQHEVGEDEAQRPEEAVRWETQFEGSRDPVVLVIARRAVQAERCEGQSLARCGQVGFRELDGFVGATF